MKRNVVSYMKQRGVFFLLYMCIVGIFWCVLYLYNSSRSALDYAALLSLALIVVVVAVDFILYVKHIKGVEYTLSSLPYELRDSSTGNGPAEENYRIKVRELFLYKEELENNTRIGRQEMLDYYSLWAHQIKTPIAAMHLLVQSMEEETEAQESRFLRPMKMELFKTEQYVEMVLSYLRLDGINSDFSFQWYDIDGIVRQAVRKYSQLFILKRIQLDYQTCEGKVLTDEKWLLLAIEQLLSNALKYTSGGKISICMDEKEENLLVIEDNGIGIQSEDLPRIFEKGFTGYNGRQDKKSTGIGLYLCKTVCDKLNHGLRIESEPGKGTKVYVDLQRSAQVIE